MRYIYFIFVTFLLLGCGGTSEGYLLSLPGQHIPSTHMRFSQIGVDQITVPDYLLSNKIPIQKTPQLIVYRSDAKWVSSPEKALTSHLIVYLKKRFSTPNVHRYPWDVEKNRGVRLKVEINNFVYKNGVVELEANYFVASITGGHKISRFFKTSTPVQKDETELIVAAMNKAFDRLAAHAARTVASF